MKKALMFVEMANQMSKEDAVVFLRNKAARINLTANNNNDSTNAVAYLMRYADKIESIGKNV